MRTLTAWLLVLGLALPSGAAAEDLEKHFHESFEVGKDTRLDLRHGDGDVEVSVWDRDVVDVEVHYHLTTHTIGVGSEPTFDVDFLHEGNHLLVEGLESGWSIVGIGSRIRREYRYTIKVPEYVRIYTEGDDGDVKVKGLRAGIQCDLEDGDVTLRDIEAAHVEVTLDDGDLILDTVHAALQIRCEDGDVEVEDSRIADSRFEVEDGDVRLQRCSGAIEIETEDGDAEVGDHGGPIVVRTEDGDVQVRPAAEPAPDVDVRTSDGNVHVVVAPGTSTAFLLVADDGSITVQVDEPTRIERSRRGTYGELGGGEGSIRVETDDGSIVFVDGGSA